MMLQRCLIPLLWAHATSLLFGLSAAVENDTNTQPPNAAIVAYMVEFIDGYSDIDSFYHQLDGQHIKYSPRLNLTYSLFKGVSFALDGYSETGIGHVAQKLADMPMVQTVWPIHPLQASGKGGSPSHSDGHNATAFRSAPSIHNKRQTVEFNGTADASYSPHKMIQADRLHQQGITGQGIRVAVLDSGIDYTHPALGGCFGPGCLVTHGYDWFDEDADPKDDCSGHGTHVAGIIAAQPNTMGFTGAAPGVTLGAYRVSNCQNGYISEDVVVAAYNQAFDDGFDVISLSGFFLGNAWNQHPVAVAVQRITEAGVHCVAAMGNDGRAGLWTSGAPATGLGVAAVANFINEETPAIHVVGQYRLDNSSEPKAFGWHAGRTPLPTLSLPLRTLASFYNNSNENIDACQPLPSDIPDLSRFLILVRDGGCRLEVKTANIGDRDPLSGKNIILYSQTEFTTPHTDALLLLNVGSVPLSQGEEWLRLLEAGHSVTVDITDKESAPQRVHYVRNSDTGGLVAPGSSWGLSWELDVKPQFGAPGQNILSTYPVDHERNPGGYWIDGGTSMATPLVSAAYALLLQAHGKRLDPATLQNLLSATAKSNIYYDGTRTYPGLLAPVAQQGAGIIQAYDAAFSQTHLNVSSLGFNDTDHFTSAISFTIRNLGNDTVTYRLSHVPAATVYASELSFLTSRADWILSRNPLPLAPDAYASLTFSPDASVSIPPDGSATITVHPTPPSGLDPGRLPLYSGYIAINGSRGEAMSLPYAGVAGSLRSAPVLESAPGEGSYLGYWNTSWEPAPGTNLVFTIPEPDLTVPVNGEYPDRENSTLPVHVFSRKVATAFMRVDLVVIELFGNATLETSVVLGVEMAGMVEWWPKVWWPGRGADVTPFRGVLADGRAVPEGRYQFLARALKVFGDREDPEDWDALELPEFELRYE